MKDRKEELNAGLEKLKSPYLRDFRELGEFLNNFSDFHDDILDFFAKNPAVFQGSIDNGYQFSETLTVCNQSAKKLMLHYLLHDPVEFNVSVNLITSIFIDKIAA